MQFRIRGPVFTGNNMQPDPQMLLSQTVSDPQAAALQNLLDLSPASMFSLDGGLCYTAFNRKHAQGMQALCGLEIHPGDNFLECIQLPADREAASRNLARALAGEEFTELITLGSEERFKITILLLHTPIRAENGAVVGVHIYSEDVTDLRKAEDRLLDYQHHMEALAQERAEQARRASEAKFKILFHSLPLPSAIFRLVTSPAGELLDWIIEDANDFGAAVFGKAPQDLPGHRVSEFVEAHILAPYLAVCQDIRASGGFRMFESFFEPHQRHYLTTAFMLSPDLYAIINLDITEEKEAEARLRESEERYRLLFTSCLDGVLITGPDGSVQAANQAALEMLGWTAEELKRLTRRELFDQQDPLLPSARREHSRLGRYMGELTVIRKDGSKFPGEVSTCSFTDWRGKRSMGIFIYDLSIRRQLEEALSYSEELFRLLLANSLEAILLTTPGNGSIQQANPAAERLFGWTEAELCALGRGRIMDMSSLGAQNAVKQRGIAGHFTGEVTHFRKDGSKFPARSDPFSQGWFQIPGPGFNLPLQRSPWE